MRFPIGLLTGFALLLTAGARAATAADPGGWAEHFAAAAGSGDGARIIAVAAEIAYPTLSRDKLAGTVNAVLSHMAGRRVMFSARFAGREVGSFFKRVTVAVGYGDRYLFFSADLVRGPDGWQRHAFDMNELLAAPLPFS